MTHAQRQAVIGWWAWLRENAAALTLIFFVIGVMGSIAFWASGGVKMQSQIDIDDFRRQLSAIQTTQTDQAKAAKEAQLQAQSQAVAAQQQAQAFQDRILTRLDAMPRPSDYANQDARMSKLDDRLGAAEKLESNHEGRISALEHPQYRNTPR